MSPVAQTSVDALERFHQEGRAQSQRDLLLAFLRECDRSQGWTRNELAETLGLRLSSVCGVVDDLLAETLVFELARRVDEHSTFRAKPIRLLPPVQGRLL